MSDAVTGNVAPGLIGTATQARVKAKGDQMARFLGTLPRPLYLLDTRRTGEGGTGEARLVVRTTLLVDPFAVGVIQVEVARKLWG